MMLSIRFAAIVMVAMLLSLGCQTSSSAPLPTPEPSASHKLGSDVNNAFEMGVIAVETPLFQYPKTAADGAAGTATSETPVGQLGPGPQAIQIGSCSFHTQAALTANGSNYATIQVQKRTNGGSATTIAQLATTTTSWTAFTNVNIPLAATIEFVSPNDSVTFNIAKTGTGVVVPIGMLSCFGSIH